MSFLSPILSGIADYTGNKKAFLKFFVISALSSAVHYSFDTNHMELSMLAVMLASIGFWCSLVFYNAFLPEIAPLDQQDEISARGFFMGYIGSVILLVVCLAMIMGIGTHLTKYSFLLVGLWWVFLRNVLIKHCQQIHLKRNRKQITYGRAFENLELYTKSLCKTTD